MTEVSGNRPARLILSRDHRDMPRRLHREQPRLARHIAFEPIVAVEMIGRDVEQHRDIAVEAIGQVDLIAGQFQHIDAHPLQVRLQRRLAQHRQADIAAHDCRIARLFDDMMDQRRRGRLAIGAGDADDLVRRQRRPGESEQFDVADDRHASDLRPHRDGMPIERHARRHDDAVKAGQVDLHRIADFQNSVRFERSRETLLRATVSRLRSRRTAKVNRSLARRFLTIPGHNPRAAGQQRFDRGKAGPRQPQHGIGLARKDIRNDHRSFNVARPASASTKAMIQKRITTVGSAQPNCSK